MNAWIQALASRFRFYRSRLTAADRRRYDMILSGFQSFQARLRVPVLSGSCSVGDLVQFIKLDNPELFYVDFGQIAAVYRPAYTDLLPSYLYDQSRAERIGKELAARIENILAASKAPALPPYERELFFHDFLQSRISYEQKDSDYYKAHSIEGALLYGRAVCEGYAGAFKILCDQAGLPALVVPGTAAQKGKMDRHAWNIVKLFGQCFHVDATWDSTMALEGEVCHVYFNLTDREICQNHDWDRARTPSCVSTEYNYFERSRLFFPDSAHLIRYFIRQLRAGERFFSVKTDPRIQSAETASRAFQQALLSCPTRFAGSPAYQIQYDELHGIVSIRMCE